MVSVDAVHEKVLSRHVATSHATGHLLAREHATRFLRRARGVSGRVVRKKEKTVTHLVLTRRSMTTVTDTDTVRGSQTGKVMSLHDSLEPLADPAKQEGVVSNWDLMD